MDKCGQIVGNRLSYQFCENSHLAMPTAQTSYNANPHSYHIDISIN